MNTATVVLSVVILVLVVFIIALLWSWSSIHDRLLAEIKLLKFERRQMARIIYWHRECKNSAVIHRCRPAPEDQYTREWHDELV